MDYDLLVRGATIVDGTGAERRAGDVAVRGGKIVAVGEVKGSARRAIDADGRVVAPGFVDIHTHYDAQILWDRMLTISPWHGVTTVVMGNCGFGVAPTRAHARDLILKTLEKVEGMSLAALEAGLGDEWGFETFPEYLDAIEARGAAINVGVLVGHTPVRLYVMGEEATERAANDAEIAAMRAIVREAIAAGAVGFATSKSPTHVGFEGRPVPSRAAELAEIDAIAGALREVGRGVIQATVGPGFLVDELAALSRSCGRPVTWTALLAGMGGPGAHKFFLERSEAVAREGVPVVPQVSCRPLNFEYQFREPFPFESMSIFKPISAAGDDAGKIAVYSDSSFRAAFRERMARGFGIAGGGLWERTTITWHPPAPELEERSVAEVARECGRDPVDVALDLAIASKLDTRFRAALVNSDEDEVEELLRHPVTMLGLSDAGAHASQLCDACFSTHLLGRWVRERKALELEQAVRMLTSRVAEVFGITDRGRVAPGLAADLVVFDPATVGATKLRRVNDMPGGADRLVADGIGIDLVVVNGTVIREEGRDAVDAEGPLPGTLLRSGRSSS